MAVDRLATDLQFHCTVTGGAHLHIVSMAAKSRATGLGKMGAQFGIAAVLFY